MSHRKVFQINEKYHTIFESILMTMQRCNHETQRKKMGAVEVANSWVQLFYHQDDISFWSFVGHDIKTPEYLLYDFASFSYQLLTLLM